MKKSMMLIINPWAGKGSFRGSLGRVLEVFGLGGYLVTVYFTDGPRVATDLATRYASGYDLVVCLGGDGTLSEVVSGLMTLESPPPLGYIPLGTANDVAFTLNLPRQPLEAAQLILEGRPIPLDVGRFGDEHYFAYIAAFGAFTEVSYETPQETKQALGHLAYLLEAMARLPLLSHYPTVVEYDGGVIRENLSFGAVTNSTSVAGLVKLDGDCVDLSDGEFEILLIKRPGNMGEMSAIVSDLLSRNFTGAGVTFLRSRRARFIFPAPVAWTRDGENGGMHADVTITNRPSAIRIIK